ncbi:hypothetical protein FRC12_010585 [Ceratobasidium sp. 428]|nr:hypothetical protein FRC12_010585 [Ceratobasidium sp. 428]
MELMAEQEYLVGTVNKPELEHLLKQDNFLYPLANGDKNHQFRIHAIGTALEIILFRGEKLIGYVVMDQLCWPNNPVKCAHWHCKLLNPTAWKGVPPGLIAYAATQIYWELLQLYKGTKVPFHEAHFCNAWACFYRNLMNLLHLGQLRIDLRERLQKYYKACWPGEGQDSDDENYVPPACFLLVHSLFCPLPYCTRALGLLRQP